MTLPPSCNALLKSSILPSLWHHTGVGAILTLSGRLCHQAGLWAATYPLITLRPINRKLEGVFGIFILFK